LAISLRSFSAAHWLATLVGPDSRADSQPRVFALALAVSIVLHALILSLHFQLPSGRRASALAPLEVVIVNSRTTSRPVTPEVLAQANLDSGGNTDEQRRARSPLPRLAEPRAGDEVSEARRRVQELEVQQSQLLSQLPQQQTAPAAQAAPAPAETKSGPSGTALRENALAMVRTIDAQLSRRIDEYSKRPRMKFVGARAAEFRFAQYVEDWRQKVERIGNLNYPESARGRLYGSLRLSVYINADGSLASVQLERSSGYPVLDRAAERIVQMGAPYGKFPADIQRDTDILVITRTWNFVPGDKVTSSD
jgi:periplasmic protein TonB